jgi:hypothetical protein
MTLVRTIKNAREFASAMDDTVDKKGASFAPLENRMKEIPVLTIGEHGIDILVGGEYRPARELPRLLPDIVGEDPRAAEQYYDLLRNSFDHLKAMFARPSSSADTEAELEEQTNALYRRRLLYADGFQQDLYGLNRSMVLLQDELVSRIALVSLSGPQPRSARLYLMVAPNPSDLSSVQQLLLFTTMHTGDSHRLVSCIDGRYDALSSSVVRLRGAAVYALQNVPSCVRSDERQLRTTLLHEYVGIKRRMAKERLTHYPVMGDAGSQN